MDIRSLFSSLGWQARQGQRANSSPYTALPATPTAESSASLNDGLSSEDTYLKPYHGDTQPQEMGRSLPRFLADFTLGFADGLTVPFALTAGLSSLGQTNTVIYAGMAEICAGCISMGIGGYLAARGEEDARTDDKSSNDDDDDDGEDEEKSARSQQDSLEKYLAPLHLPPDLLQSVRSHMDSTGVPTLILSGSSSADGADEPSSQAPSPCFIGFSISLGYLLGGLLPLLPYFFVDDVAKGLKWSFAICIVALFIFGFVKDYLLHTKPARRSWDQDSATRSSARRRKVKHSTLEGMRMVVLGGMAAITAVLCVRVFEGIVS